MVHLGDQRPPALAQAVDQPVLPERVIAVQPLRHYPGHQGVQVLIAARRRKRGLPQLVPKVEIRIIDPDRPPEDGRTRAELLRVDRELREAGFEHGPDLFIGRRRTLEHRDGPDREGGVLVLVLRVDELGVHRLQSLHRASRPAATSRFSRPRSPYLTGLKAGGTLGRPARSSRPPIPGNCVDGCGRIGAVSIPFPSPTGAVPSRSEVFAGYLDYFRSRVLAKVMSLPEAELHRSRVPSGWTPLELLKHLRYVELRWLEWGFEGRDVGNPWADSRDDRWHVDPGESLEQLAAELTAQGGRS